MPFENCCRTWKRNLNSLDYHAYTTYVVGFTSELVGEGLLGPASNKEGALIVECGSCFKKFWFHIDKVTAKHLKMLDDRWPK